MKKIFSIGFFLSILFSSPIYTQWQMMNSPLATPDIRKVAYHPDGYIFTITDENEVFRSDINGENWQKISTLDDEATSLAISSQGIIYAGTYYGYFASSDNGNVWEEKQLFSNYGYISDIEFNSLGVIFMSQGGSGYNITYSVFHSTDNGITWDSSLVVARPIGSIAKDSFENLYAIAKFGYIYKSTNSGFDWQFLSYVNAPSEDLEIDSNNNFFLGSNDGIYKSTDLGYSWSLINIPNSYINNIYIDSDNNIYGFYSLIVSFHFNGIYFSSNGGANWEIIGLGGINLMI